LSGSFNDLRLCICHGVSYSFKKKTTARRMKLFTPLVW